jgi:hypothetical protein
MTILVQSGDPERTPSRWRPRRAPPATEFREALAELGITQHRFAQLCGVSPRCVRRWQSGDRRIPNGIGIILRLLAAGAVTITQVEQAASPAPASTRRNGSTQPPCPVNHECRQRTAAATAEPEPAPEAGVGFHQLGRRTCRWPLWENQLPAVNEMRFCGGATVAGSPYCSSHTTVARRIDEA